MTQLTNCKRLEELEVADWTLINYRARVPAEILLLLSGCEGLIKLTLAGMDVVKPAAYLSSILSRCVKLQSLRLSFLESVPCVASQLAASLHLAENMEDFR